MFRKSMALVLSVLLAQAVATAAPAASNAPIAQDAQEAGEQVKSKVARAGIGEKAKVTVKLKDGTKIKGYISQAREVDFIVRDRKTDQPSIVRYGDVAKLENNRGHSTAKAVTIGVIAGVGAVLAVLGILFATLDD
ncbi:MAG: hypothetical protein ACRD9R_20885 [Pyrinomonadaceae bacterium]